MILNYVLDNTQSKTRAHDNNDNNNNVNNKQHNNTTNNKQQHKKESIRKKLNLLKLDQVQEDIHILTFKYEKSLGDDILKVEN